MKFKVSALMFELVINILLHNKRTWHILEDKLDRVLSQLSEVVVQPSYPQMEVTWAWEVAAVDSSSSHLLLQEMHSTTIIT